MHHRWTASADAGFSRRAASQDDVRWLRRRGPKGLRAGGRGRRAGGFLRLTASLSVGALLTISSAGSAIGPAAAHSAGAVDVPATEPRLSFDLPVFDTPIPGLPREFSARREDGAEVRGAVAADADEPDPRDHGRTPESGRLRSSRLRCMIRPVYRKAVTDDQWGR